MNARLLDCVVTGVAWAVAAACYPVAVAVTIAVAPGAAALEESMAASTEWLEREGVPGADR